MIAQKHSLSKRLIYSTIILSIVYYINFHTSCFVFIPVNMLVIALALYEFFTMTENKGLEPHKIVGIIFGVLFPLFVYYPGEILIFGSAILTFSFLNFNSKNKHAGFLNTATTLFGLVYVGLLLSYFTKLRFLDQGTLWVVFAIWVTKMGDAGAYFIGTHFGKLKPFKKISPNKSVEGAVGGLIVSFLSAIILKAFFVNIPFIHFVLLGILLGVLSQFGDLAESLIKRECNVKDSGTIPGLGGILDIMDSLIFTVPFLYYYIKVFIEF
ncbi:MAG: phosphatidate cytidylyltransferase [Candidatus Omnitrophica bacterium]|nr:phosphatidate cytidylyltransferase [Candidatus Omnitrophota bacterium]